MKRSPWEPSTTELARSVRAGERSPVEVVDAHLERIAGRNDAINAFLIVSTGGRANALARPRRP